MQFDQFREKLLRAGVAPRHVRRYLTELNEHMADLIQIQHGTGYTGEDAVARARAALGNDNDLAQAMISRRGVKSWSAKAPWLVFTLFPFLTVLLLVLLTLVIIGLVGGTHGLLGPHARPWPEWFRTFAAVITHAGNLLIAPAVALLFALLSWRQRLSLKWPLLMVAILLFLFPHWDTQAQHYGVLGLRYNFNKTDILSLTMLAPFGGSVWQMIADQWPWVIAQSSLTALPMLWLWKRSKSDTKQI